MSKQILIIDDDEGDCEIIKMHLQAAGFNNVIMANSGEKGVISVNENKPDIVITDTNLMGMDGFEVCKIIKEIDGLQVKVIVVTGHVDAVDAQKAREMGADDYCVKTSDCVDLIEAVTELG